MNQLKKYLINLGFKVTDGLSYGVDLLVYTDNIEKVHSKYAILIETNQIWIQIIGIQRVCSSVNKKLIIARQKNKNWEFYSIERFIK